MLEAFSDDYVPSTVPNDQAMATGGKTVTGKPTVSTGSDAAIATNASSDDSAAEKSAAPADALSQQQPVAAPQASAPVDASGSDDALAPAA